MHLKIGAKCQKYLPYRTRYLLNSLSNPMPDVYNTEKQVLPSFATPTIKMCEIWESECPPKHVCKHLMKVYDSEYTNVCPGATIKRVQPLESTMTKGASTASCR